MMTPDVDIAFGDTGICRQDEQYRMGVGDQVERQLRLGTDRVQTRRIDNHQPLFQQGMREIDDGMAPLRNFNAAQRIDGHRGVRIILVVEAVELGLFHRHPFCQADLLESFQHAVRG